MFDDFQDMEEEQEGHVFGAYEPPEPDGLELPRLSNLCIGHELAEKSLLDFINSGAMPHAIIFSGPVGIGKSTLAFRLARYLLKHGTPDAAQDSLFGDAPAAATSLDVASDDPVFHRVASGGHPDLLTLERPIDARKGIQKNALDVETARKVAPFLRKTSSYDGGWRVVIVDDADSMNRNAQNALLKILEEPPSNALLILVCHRLGAMIPTIRSRCRVLNIQPLSEDSLATLMSKEIGNSLSETDQLILTAMAGGSIGIAKSIIESGGLEVARILIGMMDNWPQFNWVDIHHLAENAGRAGRENDFENIERVFQWFTESIVFAKAKKENVLAAPLNGEPFQKMMNDIDLEGWLDITEKLKSHFQQAHFSNLDKRQATLDAFHIISP